MTTLPDKARAVLADCPSSGGGVHRWLFRAACTLHRCGVAPDIIAAELRTGSANCGRYVGQREIQDAVTNSTGHHTTGRAKELHSITSRPRKWPSRDAAAVAEACADGFGLADLWELSPLHFDDAAPHTEDIIDVLFPDNPWLCVGASSTHFDTRHREDWRGCLHRAQFIVPSPMTDKTGRTKTGRISTHTLDNTGTRRFLVVEFDEGTHDEHAALLRYLADLAPLVLAVMSGGKSLHGWFYVQPCAEDKLRELMQYAAAYGADPATWTRSQFVRIPDGTRNNGNRQSILFFNPHQLNQ